jgi:ubiquitin-protein ligase
MSEERFKNELEQVLRLKALLDGDTVLPLRFEITPESLNLRRFRLTLSGVTSLALAGSSHRNANKFILSVEVPPGYPRTAIPNIRFVDPIPFHPHVHKWGEICWGTGNSPRVDLFLVDWLRGVIEYLQYNQDQGSLFRIEPESPANKTAMEWWLVNSRYLYECRTRYQTRLCARGTVSCAAAEQQPATGICYRYSPARDFLPCR